MRVRGFSLAEIMVAIAVLAVLVMVLGGLLATALGAGDKGEENLAAIHLAEVKMGELKARPYSQLVALVGQTSPAEKLTSDGREYDCRFQVETLAAPNPNPDGRLLRLTVRMQWLEASALGEQGTRSERPSELQLDSVVGPGAAL